MVSLQRISLWLRRTWSITEPQFQPPSMARSCPRVWLAVLWHRELVEGGQTSWLGLGFAGQQPVLCCASSPEDDL